MDEDALAYKKKPKSRNLTSQKNIKTPIENKTETSNSIMFDCLNIKYYKNQVYDPSERAFPTQPPTQMEEEISVISAAREKDPDLQNAQEAKRLLSQAEKYQKLYDQQLRLRRGVEGNEGKHRRAQQLKQTLKNNPYFEIDNSVEG